ncbi:MAG: hypothetical protein H5T65_05660 [Chloroflexi bacterium]|nr:hypothetical protein [Chloroflexota bacterium]
MRHPRRFTFAIEQEELRLLKLRALEHEMSPGALLRRIIRAWLGIPEPGDGGEEKPPRGR